MLREIRTHGASFFNLPKAKGAKNNKKTNLWKQLYRRCSLLFYVWFGIVFSFKKRLSVHTHPPLSLETTVRTMNAFCWNGLKLPSPGCLTPRHTFRARKKANDKNTDTFRREAGKKISLPPPRTNETILAKSNAGKFRASLARIARVFRAVLIFARSSKPAFILPTTRDFFCGCVCVCVGARISYWHWFKKF